MPRSILPLLLCLWIASVHAAPPAGASLFARYENALNRHDADAVAAFWALDRSNGPAAARSDRVLRTWTGYREFEAASHARFAIMATPLGGDAFEVVQREDCDFYRWLGTGTKTSRFTVHVRGGRFHAAARGPGGDAGRDYDAALDEFRAWLLAHHAAQASAVLRDGEFVFDARSAAILLPLAEQWNMEGGGH